MISIWFELYPACMFLWLQYVSPKSAWNYRVESSCHSCSIHMLPPPISGCFSSQTSFTLFFELDKPFHIYVWWFFSLIMLSVPIHLKVHLWCTAWTKLFKYFHATPEHKDGRILFRNRLWSVEEECCLRVWESSLAWKWWALIRKEWGWRQQKRRKGTLN